MANITLVNLTNALVNATNTSLLNATPSKLAFLKVFADPIVLSFALPVLFVVVIMIFVLRNVSPVSHFLYANARIQGRSNFMVTDKLLSEITESKSLKEFKSMLKETAYADELDKAKDDLRSIHIGLEKGFLDSILELIELSPEISKKLFDSYLMFFESKILKIIFRARLMQTGIDESLVYHIGNLNENLLKHLLETKTVADIKVVMTPTAYVDIFEKEYENLEEFEVAIDEFVLNNFVDVIKKTKMHDSKYIIDMLNTKIDISNILAVLKFRIRGIEKEKQENLLINNKTEICSKFEQLINAETMNDFVKGFEKTRYHESLTNAFEKYEKDNSLVHFENELYRFFKKFVVDNDLSHTLGPYPLFSYLMKRELELRNLFITSRGIDGGFSVEKIRGMII